MNVSRRGFLKALGISAGALAGTRLAGRSLLGVAHAATPEPTSSESHEKATALP